MSRNNFLPILLFAHRPGTMADLSEEDCLVIRRFPLEPTIGHLRKPLQQVIESDSTESQKTKAFSSEETASDSTEADAEPGIVHTDSTVFILN